MQVSASIAASLLTGSIDVSTLTQQPGNTALINFTNNDNKTSRGIGYSNGNGSDEIGNSTYFDEAEYVARSYGPRFLSPAKAWALSSVYAFILSTGLMGNICTCIVIYKNKAMHTATNFYLFSLAVSDLTTLIFALPPELYSIWEAYPWRLGVAFCLMKSFVSEMTSYASVLTITAFTLERYVAICHPIRSQSISTLSRVVKTIIGIWLTAGACALPFPLHTELIHIRHPTTHVPLQLSIMCNVPSRWLPQMMVVFQLSTFVFFLAPMTIITVLYTLIGARLRHSEIQVETSKSDNNSMNAMTRARKAVIKMLVAVVVSFFVCWAPFNAQRLMTVYIGRDQWTKPLIDFQTKLFYISGILFFFNSTVNPLLYNLISHRYRKAFKRTLCNCCIRCGRGKNDGNDKSAHQSSRTYVSQYASRSGYTMRIINSAKRPVRTTTIADSKL